LLHSYFEIRAPLTIGLNYSHRILPRVNSRPVFVHAYPRNRGSNVCSVFHWFHSKCGFRTVTFFGHRLKKKDSKLLLSFCLFPFFCPFAPSSWISAHFASVCSFCFCSLLSSSFFFILLLLLFYHALLFHQYC
jgi:hypothetical protein